MPHEPPEAIVKASARSIGQVSVQPNKSESLLKEMDCLLEKVRVRAYELFEQRGRENGHALDDWLTAEDELGVMPVADVEESDKEFRVHVVCTDLTADEVVVYAEPQAISVKGRSVPKKLSATGSAVQDHALFGRYGLPEAIDPQKVSACLEDGVLKIEAKKMIAFKPVTTPSPALSSKRKVKRRKSTEV